MKRHSQTGQEHHIEKLSFLRTLSWDFTKPQLPVGATLTKRWNCSTALLKPVVLVIDEAQHALTTESGYQCDVRVEGCPDQLNQGRDEEGAAAPAFTGSNRDKLAYLVLGKSQPFFGSASRLPPRFPHVGSPRRTPCTSTLIWRNQSVQPCRH